MFPTSSDAYDSYIEWQYAIGGLDDDEWQFMVDNIKLFALNLTSLIEAGFDDDDNIEYQLITVNVTDFNGFDVDKLTEMDWNSREEKMEIDTAIEVTSYTNCSESECLYLIGDRFSQSAFAQFVTGELRDYFALALLDVSASTTESNVSTLSFNVSDHSVEAISLYPDEAPSTTRDYVYFALMGISGLIALVGLLSLAYAWGFMVCLPHWVDVCLWSSWIGLALQFWDFASDIALCQELWTHDDLWDPQKRMILVSAIGSTTFIVIPYGVNLYISASIKRYIKNNDAASAWYVGEKATRF